MKNNKKGPALSERSESKGPAPKIISRASLEEKSKGFTLIEVLIAVLILAMAVVAAVVVERSSLRSDSLHRHRFQATGLAQQGLNLTRSIRDTNIINSSGIWTNLGYDPVDPSKVYFLDLVDGKWQLKDKSQGEDITLDGLKFNRKIYVE